MNNAATNIPALTAGERDFIGAALIQWRSAASWVPLPISAFGFSDWPQFDAEVDRLRVAVAGGQPLSDVDWARTLLLTEIAWASDLIGTGVEFALVNAIPDETAVKLLRSIQRKVSNGQRARLLFPGQGRPRESFGDPTRT